MCGMASSTKAKSKTFTCPLFNVKAQLLVGKRTREQADAISESWGYTDKGMVARAFFVYNPDNLIDCLIWVEKPVFITHEAYHLVQWVLSSRGIPSGKKNEELVAYYMEYWTKALKEALR